MAASQYTCEAVSCALKVCGPSQTGRQRGPFNCISCNELYFTRRPKGEGEKYCSRQCSQKRPSRMWGRESIRLRTCSVWFFDCAYCHKAAYSRMKGARYCSGVCSSAHLAERRSNPRRQRSCRVCGVAYTALLGAGTRLKSYCSDECRLVGLRCAKSADRAKRRHRLRKSGAHTSGVNPLDIFRRDGWRCQGCGCDAPANLRGTCDDNAPELDHIVAVARGGSHSKGNLQTLCRLCNQIKSDKPMGEFLMDIKGIAPSHAGGLQSVNECAPSYTLVECGCRQ